MNTESTTSSEHTVDADYRFGRPKVYLAQHELARLILLRSRLGDTHADRIQNAGDFNLNAVRN